MADIDERDASLDSDELAQKPDNETVRAELMELKTRVATLRQQIEDLERKL